MIIKIVTKNEGCIVFDGFSKIRYKSLSFAEAQKLDTDVNWLEDIFKEELCVWITGEEKFPSKDKLRSGTELSIVASGRVYLCNDEGKTIEKLN